MLFSKTLNPVLRLKDVPSKLNNHCYFIFSLTLESLKRIVVKPSIY